MGYQNIPSMATADSVGHGTSYGHRVDDVMFPKTIDYNTIGFGNPLKSLARQTVQNLGDYHDEGGQVAVVNGEFFGRYRVRVGTQEMFDNGLDRTCYSGVAGEGYKCQPYSLQRRLSFVVPMGLPLGTVLVLIEALESSQSPIRASLSIVKRPIYTRLYSIARSFPLSYDTRVSNTIIESELYR